MKIVGIATLCAALLAGGTASAAERLYACGGNEVREYQTTDSPAVETWRWSADKAGDLPEIYRTKLLSHIDDCKSVEGGRTVLVTASTGGVVLIDRATGQVKFRATAPMAHSADLLPGGYLAVALSHNNNGNRLELYRLSRNETPLVSLPLPSGHGVVWDQRRQRLLVVSHDLIQAFAFDPGGQAPRLTETARWTLPGRHDGQDLSLTPEGGYVVTTVDGAWTFDADGGGFAPIPALNPTLHVKALSVSQTAIASVQADDRWWADGFTIAARDGSTTRQIKAQGMKLYKVRWIESPGADVAPSRGRNDLAVWLGDCLPQ